MDLNHRLTGRLIKAPESLLDAQAVSQVVAEAKLGRRHFIRHAFAAASVVASAPMARVAANPVSIEADKIHTVVGWALAAESACTVPGNKPVWDVVESWLKNQRRCVARRKINTPKLLGVGGNAGHTG